MPTLVLSIVTWNSAKSIHACIESALHQDYDDYRIVVIDNDSHDGTRQILEKTDDSRVRVYYMESNTGYCGGHNFAIANSASEFVLLVNPDVILSPDYCRKAIARMSKESAVGTLCGVLLQSSAEDVNCKIDSAGLNMHRDRRCTMRHHGAFFGQTNLIEEYVFGSDGALPLYRRAMIEDVSVGNQFFDELFFSHKEDWDIAWRSQLKGWRTLFYPECVAIHPREFRPSNIKLRMAMPKSIKYHAVKNHLLLVLKNEDLHNFLRDCCWIIGRQLLICLFILFREPSSLRAFTFVMVNQKRIRRLRQKVQSGRRVGPAEVRKMMGPA